MGSEESGPRRYRRHDGACLRRVRLRRIQHQQREPTTRRPATRVAWVEPCHARRPLIADSSVPASSG